MSINENPLFMSTSSSSSSSSSSTLPSTAGEIMPSSHATRVESASAGIFDQDAHSAPAKREANLTDRVSTDTIDYSERNEEFINTFSHLFKGRVGVVLLRALKERKERQEMGNQVAAATTTQPLSTAPIAATTVMAQPPAGALLSAGMPTRSTSGKRSGAFKASFPLTLDGPGGAAILRELEEWDKEEEKEETEALAAAAAAQSPSTTQ